MIAAPSLAAQDAAAPAPCQPVPTPRQLAWQERAYIGFLHFGVNTFTGAEWGEGTEDPAVFNPTDLDCRQWARAMKDAGMSLAILTAKHHDGFCLWPSAYTDHSVAASPWRDGQGDVVREFVDACREVGLDVGLYLSPWDRHEPTYGDSPAYNQFYLNQLRELLTHYGPIHEVWFDGACGEGPNGKRQEYDWDAYYALVRELQPEAVMFNGPDVRWVGNEDGYAADPNWSVVDRGTPAERWLPAEVDVSIRPGWFYHAEQDDQVKSLDHLLDIWHHSVGLNGVLLLNLPPDQRGLLHETDVARLRELREAVERLYGDDLAHGRPATADSVRGDGYAAARAVDGDDATFWAAADGDPTATLEVTLDGPTRLARAWLAEPIALGQRVAKFRLEARVDGTWQPLADGQTIGYRRLIQFEPVTADAVRLIIDESRCAPLISRLGVF